MYAKVIVDITHEKLDKIFEYRIPAELEELKDCILKTGCTIEQESMLF